MVAKNESLASELLQKFNRFTVHGLVNIYRVCGHPSPSDERITEVKAAIQARYNIC